MRSLILFAKLLVRNTQGATALEYGLILAGIVIAIFGALQAVGGSTGDMWNNVSTKVVQAH